MYEYIKGTLEEKSPNHVVLDVQGIGYKIYVPTHHFSKLPDLGEKVKLYTFFLVKEDEQSLYGFLNPEEKMRFELFIQISGVGPKLAMAIISHLDAESFQEAVFSSNIRLISKIPGIGKKMAERLILETKDKLASISQKTSSSQNANPTRSDLLNALVHLGYHPMQAQKATQKIITDHPETTDLGSLITLALRII